MRVRKPFSGAMVQVSSVEEAELDASPTEVELDSAKFMVLVHKSNLS